MTSLLIFLGITLYVTLVSFYYGWQVNKQKIFIKNWTWLNYTFTYIILLITAPLVFIAILVRDTYKKAHKENK